MNNSITRDIRHINLFMSDEGRNPWNLALLRIIWDKVLPRKQYRRRTRSKSASEHIICVKIRPVLSHLSTFFPGALSYDLMDQFILGLANHVLYLTIIFTSVFRQAMHHLVFHFETGHH